MKWHTSGTAKKCLPSCLENMSLNPCWLYLLVSEVACASRYLSWLSRSGIWPITKLIKVTQKRKHYVLKDWAWIMLSMEWLLWAHGFLVILQLKADVNACTFGGNSPLHLAASLGSPPLCSMLIAAGKEKHVHPSLCVLSLHQRVFV